MSFSRLFFRTSLLLLAIAPCALTQIPQAKSTLKTLIVGGGPSVKQNEYAIESNARYIERLTASGQQRVLFANGVRNSRTITTLQDFSKNPELAVLLWLTNDRSGAAPVLKAPTLKRLDGSSSPKSILKEVDTLTKTVKTGDKALIYFTGHGGEGKQKGFFGSQDYTNTTYNGWGSDLSVQQLASTLQKWPDKVPLTLVMVQCHSGGFANLIWNDGDFKNGIWSRDFCGFFASTGDRMSSGCTSEMDERDYQDFTTHFFAALSGTSRDGRRITGADYDRNGAVSGLEAFAYTNLNNQSIDVPMSTSDLYLRRILGEAEGNDWMKTPYSTILNDSAPWQKAMLNGLSRELKLSGEKRIETANTALENLDSAEEDYEYSSLSEEEMVDYRRNFYLLQDELFRRYPALKSKNSPQFAASKAKALTFLKTRPKAVNSVFRAYTAFTDYSDSSELREAKLYRFMRASYTVVLQKRLRTKGTPEQKAIFARLRTSESRNFLK
jgi:hypothetical protein